MGGKRGGENVCRPASAQKEKASTKRDEDGRWSMANFGLSDRFRNYGTVRQPFRPVSLRRRISEALLIRATTIDMEESVECQVDSY